MGSTIKGGRTGGKRIGLIETEPPSSTQKKKKGCRSEKQDNLEGGEGRKDERVYRKSIRLGREVSRRPPSRKTDRQLRIKERYARRARIT